VLNVRPLKPPGLARLWQKPMIEVIKQQVDLNNSGWRVAALLQKTGLLPLHAQHVLDGLKSAHGDIPPASLAEEITWPARNWPGKLARALRHRAAFHARPDRSRRFGQIHRLCKWLTQAALVEGRQARVWRLDGATANTAEFLSVHGEALNAEVERCWTPTAAHWPRTLVSLICPGWIGAIRWPSGNFPPN
jgi:hypothetical protein